MMRSLFSAVSGLKTHQTRMDVIGNNIANVNTEAFKASSVRFSELMYQTMSTASGGDASTGTGGVNAKQVGLGVSTASTMINITGAGSSETTGNPFDLKLSDSQTTKLLYCQRWNKYHVYPCRFVLCRWKWLSVYEFYRIHRTGMAGRQNDR